MIHFELTYFGMYNTYFFAQIFEGKIRMNIIHGYNDYIPWVNNPVYNVHKNMGAHYTRQNIVSAGERGRGTGGRGCQLTSLLGFSPFKGTHCVSFIFSSNLKFVIFMVKFHHLHSCLYIQPCFTFWYTSASYTFGSLWVTGQERI